MRVSDQDVGRIILEGKRKWHNLKSNNFTNQRENMESAPKDQGKY